MPIIPADCMRILLAFKLSGDKYSRTPQMSINVPPNALILSRRITINKSKCGGF